MHVYAVKSFTASVYNNRITKIITQDVQYLLVYAVKCFTMLREKTNILTHHLTFPENQPKPPFLSEVILY